MPFRGRKRKRTFRRRRRTFKRRRKGAGGSSKYRRSRDAIMYAAPTRKGVLTGAFPSTYFCKLPFEEIDTQTVAANFNIIEYQPSGLNNCSSSGTFGYEWAGKLVGIYKRWVCLGFKYEVEVYNFVDTSGIGVYVLPWGDDDPPTTQAGITFQKGVVSRFVGPAINGGRASMTRITGYISQKKIMGANVSSVQAYWGLGSGNQSTNFVTKLFVVMENPAAPITPTLNFQVRVKFTGYFKFFTLIRQSDGPSLQRSIEGVPFAGHKKGVEFHQPCYNGKLCGVNPWQEEMEEKVEGQIYDEIMEDLAEEKEEAPTKKRACVHKCYGPDGSLNL